MPASRLQLAAESGAIDLPEGTFGWLNANSGSTLGIDDHRLHATQSFFPDHARLEARGISVSPFLQRQVDHAVIQAHRSKAASFNLIAQTLEHTSPGALISVDGDKTDGIESILKELKRRFGGVESYSKAHGKLVWFKHPDVMPDISDWIDVTYLYPNGWVTRAGVFSADGPDQGSKALASALPVLTGKVADLGAGWGYLSGEALKSETITELHGFEADFHATECAKHNVRDARAQFHWSDVLSLEENGFDVVISNPPFHTTRKPDTTLGSAFIHKAADMLKPKGALWMVANRNLPYEATLAARFRRFDVISQSGGFKVISANTPKTSRAG